MLPTNKDETTKKPEQLTTQEWMILIDAKLDEIVKVSTQLLVDVTKLTVLVEAAEKSNPSRKHPTPPRDEVIETKKKKGYLDG